MENPDVMIQKRIGSLMETSHHAQAIPLIKDQLSRNPEDAWLWISLSSCYFRTGRLTEALHAAEEAIRYEPAHEECHWNRARVLFNMQHYAESLKSALEAARLAPEVVYIQVQLSRCLYRMGRMEEAWKAAARACNLEPSCSGVWRNLGWLSITNQEWAHAEIFLRKTLTLDPHDLTALEWLASALSKQGKRQEAMELYRRVLAVHVEPSTLTNLAYQLSKNKEWEAAISLLEGATQAFPAETFFWEAWIDILHTHKQKQAALNVTQRALVQFPHSANLWCCLANCWRQIGNTVEYHAAVARAAQEDPHAEKVLEWLTVVEVDQGRLDAALQIAKQAVVLYPSGEKGLFACAHLYMRMGLLEEADQICRQWLQLQPGSSSAYIMTSQVQAALGQQQSAWEIMRAACDKNPWDVELWRQRAIQARWLGDVKDTLEALQQMQTLEPEPYLLQYILGQAAAVQGDWERAKQAFAKAIQANKTCCCACFEWAYASMQGRGMADIASLSLPNDASTNVDESVRISLVLPPDETPIRVTCHNLGCFLRKRVRSLLAQLLAGQNK